MEGGELVGEMVDVGSVGLIKGKWGETEGGRVKGCVSE